MSGFEIVGVVLGAFPIILQGVSFYAEGAGIIRDVFRYQQVLKRISRDLAREHTIFSNSCRRFMENVAHQCEVGEEEIGEMMQEPKDPRWKEGSLVQEHIFSQNSVQQYLDAVEDMNGELEKIRELTAISGDNSQPALLDKKNLKRQWKKLILIIKKGDIGRHLDEAGRLNSFLARLTEQNQPLLTTRHVTRRSAKHYRRIRAHAIDLHDILRDKFPTSPTCNCMLRHDVNMKLEFRSAKITAKGIHFHAIFTTDNTFSTLRNWREIETEPWRNEETNICHEPDNHTRVKFTVSSPFGEPQYEDIPDLCALIGGSVSSQEWLGYITSKAGRQHRIRTMDHQQKLPSFKSIDVVSLAEVLNDPTFRRPQRSRLGLKLASSVMQLHTTEWLRDSWNKNDILFSRSLDATIDFDNPFIRRSFGSHDTQSSIPESLPKVYSASIPCLFSLGVVLLELEYRKVFEDMKNEHERNLPSVFSDAVAARRLADEMDCGPNYKNSVLRCIAGLDAAYSSLTEGKFQDEVDEKVLSPLEEDLKFYCSRKLIEDCI